MSEIVLDEQARFTFRDALGRTLHVFHVPDGLVLHIDDPESSSERPRAVLIDVESIDSVMAATERISHGVRR